MKTRAILAVTLLMLLPLSAFAADQITQVDRPQGAPTFLGYVPDEFIVVMAPEAGQLNISYSADNIAFTGRRDMDLLADRFQVTRIKRQFPGAELAIRPGASPLARFHKVKIGAGSLDEAMAAYRDNPAVERVEPIGIHTMYATPNDTYYSPYQTYHHQADDHDIDSPEAWDLQTGSSSVIVAILDSGTRYYHPDLGGVNASPTNVGASRGNMWINNAELNGAAGVDDDGNGYTDDWIGYDFIDGVSNCWTGEDCNTKDNDPRDFNGHGTHTAGIFGMMTNDGYGMAGVAGGWGSGSQTEYGNGVKIMALRMGYSYNYLGQEYGVVMMDAAAEAFYYAANNGAKIASCSWGSSNSGGIGAAVDYFQSQGGLVFVAAGNDGSQTADYLNGRGDCVSVAAVDVDDSAASFTTYGTWVDISAPGVTIYSTYHDHTDPNTDYWAALDGTSMATPMAAGVGALIWSQNPGWTAAQVENQLYTSADNIDAFLTSTYLGKMGAGRINSYNAVNTGPPPAPVAAFVGTPTSGTNPLTVNFTDQSTGSPTSWSWTFGDGGTSTAQNPSHQYTADGTYSVSLTVSNANGSDTDTKLGYITVTASPPPTAAFTGTPTSGDFPLDVTFTDQSTGSPTSWSWTFGDGGTSTAQNPVHTYTAAGTYDVSLTASNANGSDIDTKLGYITVTEPGAVIVAKAVADLPSRGTVSGSYVDTWSADGVYEVITETVSDNHPVKTTSWLEHSWRFDVTGGNAVNFKLRAAGAGNDGDTFAFSWSTDQATWNPLVTVASATMQDYTVGIPAGTSGTVYVRVIDTNRGWGNIDLDSITVDYLAFETDGGTPQAPVADFTGTPTSGNYPLNVSFSDQSTGNPDSWSWTFGDGGTSTAQNPSHTYTAAGTYTVSLTATNTSGSDTNTKVDYITVTEPGGGSTMHVADMVVTRKAAGPNANGMCTVTIQDAGGAAVANATVTLLATGPVGGTYSGITGSDGTTTVSTGKTKSAAGEWCFEVTDVTHASYTYDPAANVVTKSCESGAVYSAGAKALTDGRANITRPFHLSQNHPNPFRSATMINFTLDAPSPVKVVVYDVTGRMVATLADRHFNEGTYSLEWNAQDAPGGMYFYRIQAGKNVATKRMLLLN